MKPERALHRRYVIAGILCSLTFHGLIVFLPLRRASVLNAPLQTFSVGLIEATPPVAGGWVQKAPVNPKRAELEDPPQGGVPRQKSRSESAVEIPGADQGVVPEEALETPHGAPAPSVAEPEFPGAASEAPQPPQPSVQGPISIPNLYEEATVLRAVGSVAVVSVSRRENPEIGRTPKETTPAELSSMAPPPVAARAEETKDERPTPEVATKEPAQPEEIAEAAGQNSPAASRALVTAPATTFANTPRQYFAPSSDLFAQARNWATPSSAKASAAGGASAPHSDSDEARAAVPGEATLSQYEQNEQRAELSAERLDAYHAMRGQAKAVPASVSIQNQGTPQPQDIKVSGLVRQESLSQNRSPQDEASAMEYAFGTGGAAVLSSELPFPVPQSSKTLTEAAPVGEGLGDAAPGQEEPVQPWSGQDTAAPLPHAGMAESIPPRFDTMESLTQRILAALSAQKEYPPAALRRKTEGTVKLSLDVAPNGSLVMVKVQARSGSAILDEAALKLVRGIFPLDVRLASVVSLMVPVEYRIPK